MRFYNYGKESRFGEGEGSVLQNVSASGVGLIKLSLRYRHVTYPFDVCSHHYLESEIVPAFITMSIWLHAYLNHGSSYVSFSGTLGPFISVHILRAHRPCKAGVIVISSRVGGRMSLHITIAALP